MEQIKNPSLIFFTSLICCTWTSWMCFALPSVPIATSGTVEVEYPNSHTMVIKTSDHAILHYEDFQIEKDEEVHILQSAFSCVLHHVDGKNSSQISGSLQSSGKVVLVNTNGVSFGSDSKVDAESLIVSTLNTIDAKQFTLLSQKKSFIINEGYISSSKGSITLLGLHIRNKGSLVAESVSLGAVEQITFDETKGCPEEALIEHLGTIQADRVFVKLPMAKKTVTENEEVYELFIEEHGKVVMGATSQMKAQKVSVEGAHISIQGTIDATNFSSKGGDVHLFGEDIFLKGSKINVSGLMGGGEVLIGGEFQGKGTTPYASKVFMDGFSEIRADALEEGDGGLVVLWSQDKTQFNGGIYAQGGFLGGNGGCVETSGQKGLHVETGRVNTSAFRGSYGQWLLDPNYVYINDDPSHPSKSTCAKSSGIHASCSSSDSDCRVDLSTINAATSDVYIKANKAISMYYNNGIGIDIKAENVNLTFEVCNPETNGMSLEVEAPAGKTFYFNTNGGNITLPIYTHLWSHTSINSRGGDVDVSSVNKYGGQTDSTLWNLSIDSGGGEVTINSAANYSHKSLGELVVSNASLIKVRTPAGNASKSISIHGVVDLGSCPVVAIGNNVSIESTSSSVTMGSIDVSSSYASAVISVQSASETHIQGNVGGKAVSNTIAPGSFSISKASKVYMKNISTTGGAISITPPVQFVTNALVSSQGGSISFGGSVTPSSSSVYSLTCNAGEGSVNLPELKSFAGVDITGSTISIGGAVSSSGNLVISHTSTVTISGDVSVTGNFFETGTGALTLQGTSISASEISLPGLSLFSGTITTSKGITLVNLSQFSGTMTATDGAVSLSNASVQEFVIAGNTSITGNKGISISSPISDGTGSYNLTLDASSAGSISIGGDLSLHSLMIKNASEAYLYGIIVEEGGIDIACPIVFQGNDTTISSGGGSIIFHSSIRPSIAGSDFVMASSGNSVLGTISVQGIGTEEFSFGDISLTGLSISLAGNLLATGVVNLSGPLNITGDTSIQGPEGIRISDSITTSVSTPPILTLNAGSNLLTIGSLGTTDYPFGSISVTASNLTLGGDLITASSIFLSCPVTTSTAVTVLKGPNGITLNGPITTSYELPFLTLDAGSNPLFVSGLGSSSYPFGNLSLIGSSLTLGGSIITNGSISFSEPVIIAADAVLQGPLGITFTQAVSSKAGVSCDLTLISSGPVVVGDLGSDAQPLKNVTLSGSNIQLGSYIAASGTATITNTDLLTIPSMTMKVGGFDQNGVGSVSLGMSLSTSGSIRFRGVLTITGNTILKGEQGITIEESITPGSSIADLTLDSGSYSLSAKFLSSESNPFGAISVSASDFTLQGDLYSTTSILIYPPIVVAADTILNAKSGYGGISLLRPVTTTGGAPSLSVVAVNGPVDVSRLGSKDFPLGAISLIGTYVVLQDDITSSAVIEIGSVEPAESIITINKSLILTGDKGINLNDALVPSTEPFDLTLLSANGTISVITLGTNEIDASLAQPLKNVSLTGKEGVNIENSITTIGLLTITNEQGTTTCGAGTYPPCNLMNSQ